MKYLLLLSGIFFTIACASNNRSTQSVYPMATPNDPPNGVATKPGKNTVMLGNYKTCDGYAQLMKSKMTILEKQAVFLASFLQDLSTEKCKNSYTCHCKDNQYFIDNFRGRLEVPIYRCIEPASAKIESEASYKATANFSEEGLIKIALPRSFCNNK